MEFHRSAFRHGLSESSIVHAVDNAIASVDLEPEADPPKVLAIGPDPSGSLLEVIWLQLDGADLVIHAMQLRPTFFELLPPGDDQP